MFVHLLAPPGLSGTLQGVALGMSFGLGRGVALLIASFIYTMIEQRTLFLIVCIFNLIAAAIFSLYFLLTRQRDSTKIVNVKSIEDGKDYFLSFINFVFSPRCPKQN